MKKMNFILPLLFLASCASGTSYSKTKMECESVELNYVFEKAENVNEYSAMKEQKLNDDLKEKIVNLDYEIRKSSTLKMETEIADGAVNLHWYSFTLEPKEKSDSDKKNRHLEINSSNVTLSEGNVYCKGEMSDSAKKLWDEVKGQIDSIVEGAERVKTSC